MKYTFSGEELRSSGAPTVARASTESKPEPERKRSRSLRVPFLMVLLFILAVWGVIWFLRTDKLGATGGGDGMRAVSTQVK